MMAAWQTEVGAFQQPRISGPVPESVRSNERRTGVEVRSRRERERERERELTSKVEDGTSLFGVDGNFELDLRRGGGNGREGSAWRRDASRTRIDFARKDSREIRRP